MGKYKNLQGKEKLRSTVDSIKIQAEDGKINKKRSHR